jgi:hypothetical protein
MQDISIIASSEDLLYISSREYHKAGTIFREILHSIFRRARIFMLSLVQPHHYYQNLLSQGVGMGLGMGLIFLPSLTVTSHYFRTRRSLAMGVVIAGMFQPVDY